jgi:Raf kinase inhibitor-like YbhB/YbcL family protein
MFRKYFFVLLAAALILLGFSGNTPFYCKAKPTADSLKVKSSSFADKSYIPLQYSCDGENISPSIEWSKGPEKTKSYVLICDDPDAPSKVWVHWVLFNIPSFVTKLEQNIPMGENTAGSAVQGKNDSGDMGYSGPCPPAGIHHYHFRVYALDCTLNLDPGSSRSNVDAAMKDHILAQGEIVGLYKREK